MNVGSGLGGNHFSLPQTAQPVADSLGATRPQDGQLPVNFGASEAINSDRSMRYQSDFDHASGPSAPGRSGQSRGHNSRHNSSSKQTNDRSEGMAKKNQKPYLEQMTAKLNQQSDDFPRY